MQGPLPLSYARQPRLMSLALANNTLSVASNFLSSLPEESPLLYLDLTGNQGAPGTIELDATLRTHIFRSSGKNHTRSDRAFARSQAHVLDLNGLQFQGDISDAFVEVSSRGHSA